MHAISQQINHNYDYVACDLICDLTKETLRRYSTTYILSADFTSQLA